MLTPNMDDTSSRKFAARILFASIVLIGMLWSANAQAIPMGAWNQGGDDSNRGSSIIAQIFGGRTSSFGGETGEGEPQTGPFGNHGGAGLHLGQILHSAREWVATHSSAGGEFPHWDGGDVRPGPVGSTPVPEPSAAILFAVGVGVVATRRRF